MSAMGNLLLEIDEVVAPLVYQGATDKVIIEQTLKYVPNATEAWVKGAIFRLRFDYGSFDVYR